MIDPVYVDMCEDKCAGVSVDVCVRARASVHACVRANMYEDMCGGHVRKTCVWTCVDMCVDMCLNIPEVLASVVR